MRRLPLTPLQTSVVLASVRSPKSGSYILQDILDLPEDVNAAALQEAWKRVAARHTILRTSIEGTGEDVLRQCVLESPQTPWRELDWSEFSAQEQEQRLAAILEQDWQQGFDFEAGPPLRFLLIRRAECSYTLVWTYHHVLLDGRSALDVWHEWFTIYEALLAAGAVEMAPARPFHDYADWIQQQDLGPAEQFWRKELTGVVQTTGFLQEQFRPEGGVATQATEFPFLQAGTSLSQDLTHRLAHVARNCGGTLNLVVLGAWALLLHRYSGANEVVFGVTHAARPPQWARESCVGVCINTLPLRVRIDSTLPLTLWLRQLTEQWREVRAHRWAPAERVQEWSRLERGRMPFDSVITYDTSTPQDWLQSRGGAWNQRLLRRQQRTDVPLTLGAYGAPVLTLHIGYDVRLFSRETVSGLVRHLQTLLEGFAAQPDAPLGALPMLPEDEERQILHEWNRTASEYPRDLCAHELMERQARRVPGQPAFERGAETISYAEANRRANQLAWLLRRRGASPEDVVAICADHSPEVAIAVLAVLKAGAAFLPLNPRLPRAHLKGMLDLARPRWLLFQEAGLEDLAPESTGVLRLDHMGPEVAAQSGDNLPAAATATNAAYVIFTAGSTGQPKAVVAIHRGLVNATVAATRIHETSERDRRLAFVPIGSDVAIAEIFNTLSCGATLVYGSGAERGSVWEFLRVLKERRITITGIPSSWWHEWVAAAGDGAGAIPDSLRLVVAGMERVHPPAFVAWKRMAGGRVRWLNAYGPTETTLQSVVYQAGSSEWEGALAPIGWPIANTRVYVLDGQGRPLPPGVAGELYIGGDGVARGYLGSPGLTAARFVPDPFDATGEGRLYRTGDIVFFLPDGNLVFVGRADRQVKIRGFRVELDGIEAILAEHPAVRQCAVVLTRHGGLERLTAYAAVHGEPSGTDDLRRHLTARVAAHAVPSAFVILSRLPLTPSGKIDREALAREHPPDPAPASAAYQPPATLLEIEIAALWQQVLGIEHAGAGDNFFEAGGNSLLTTRLLALIRKQFGCEIPLAAFWNSPTIASLAAQVKRPRLEDLLEEIEALTEEEALRLVELEKRRGASQSPEGVGQTRPQ